MKHKQPSKIYKAEPGGTFLDFKPLREGIFIHLVAFVVATFLTTLIVRLIGLAVSGVTPQAVNYVISPAIFVLVWPWIISWFRLSSNSSLTFYFAIWVIVAPFALWTYFNAQFSRDVVEQVFSQPNSADVMVGLLTTIFIWLRLKGIDESLWEEVSRHKKHLAIRSQEEAMEKETSRRSSEQEKPVENLGKQSDASPVGKAKKPQEAHTLQPPKDHLGDEAYYKLALDEFEENQKVPETWAKALTLSKGDEQSAKWKYVELRVERLSKQ